MFSTLDKLDFMVGAEGARRLFQTDHRSAKQVAKDIDLSVVFAIIRCVAPRTIMKGGDKVLYSASHRPPDAVVDAIAACGARLEVGSELTPLPRARESADVLLDRAMRTLAANAGASDLDLAALEKKLLQRRPKKEKNEVEYWKRVCLLAAAAGEAMRGPLGGRWQLNVDGDLGIAFAVTRPDRAGFVNLIGRARRCIDDGVSESAAALVAMLVAPTPKGMEISLLDDEPEEPAHGDEPKDWAFFKESIPREGFVAMRELLAEVQADRPKWSEKKVQRVFAELRDEGELIVTKDERVGLNNAANREERG